MGKLLLGAVLFFIPYTLFWLHFFHVTPFQKSKSALLDYQPTPTQSISQGISLQDPKREVLSSVASADIISKTDVPVNFSIPLLPRKQVFNLSCEFASATSIIHHFTNDPRFSFQNEELAEKSLMEKIGVSQNPNLGIRMGEILEGDFTTLFKNLNQRFGGVDYYGVHAQPFIDLFAEYGLLAKPLLRENVIFSIQKAISSGHLVMVWIKIGYGQAVDVALSYGTIQLIRGEHTVVIYGYDEKGVWVMDPGSSSKRHIKYEGLIEASKFFPLPFLEVYPVSSITEEDVYRQDLDKLIGLPREKLSIAVENGSGKTGRGSQLADILRDFGYHVISLRNADNFDYEDVTISIKRKVNDYQGLLEKDLRLASYKIASISASLSEDATPDAIIIIGR